MNETPPTEEQPTRPPQKSLTELLDLIEQRANAATPGPWTHRKLHGVGGFVEAKNLAVKKAYGQEILGDDYFPELSHSKDCDFIAAARSDVPALVKALRRAVAIIASEAVYIGPLTHGYFEELSRLLTSPADHQMPISLQPEDHTP